MKIAVLEHFTAAPPGAPGDDRVDAGRAMRDAVVADLRGLSGTRVVVVGRRRDFRAALRSADAALVIAPEESGILGRLSRIVERSGRILLGPSPEAVDLLADKHRTGRVLAAAGVPTPATRLLSFVSARAALRDQPTPFVLKPRDGCGGRGVVLVRHPRQIDEALERLRKETRRQDVLAQEYVPGASASVSLFVSTGLLDLGLNRQRLRRGRTLAYLGGETFWSHAGAGGAIATARAAIAALLDSCRGVRGYLGVDLVIGPTGAVVIEVNPRLTTSYVGLRLSIRENLAALLLSAVAARPLPDRVTRVGRCRFSAEGAVAIRVMTKPARTSRSQSRARECRDDGRNRWRIISAGTSAASI